MRPSVPGRTLPIGDLYRFEAKLDGYRLRSLAHPDGPVMLLSMRDHRIEKAFAEIAALVQNISAAHGRVLVFDGELVALRDGRYGRLSDLHGRWGVTHPLKVARLALERPVAFVVFDVLVDGEEALIHRPWTHRRERLEAILDGHLCDRIRISEPTADLQGLIDRVRAERLEGLIAKRIDSTYQPGRRSPDWVKIKLEFEQELIIGGFEVARAAIGGLSSALVGHYDARGHLRYAGDPGSGLTASVRRELRDALEQIRQPHSPFFQGPARRRARWVSPEVVAQVKFLEWLPSGLLRQPVLVGIRHDKDPRHVIREPLSG